MPSVARREHSAEDRIQYLRWRTYLLANRNSFKPNTLALRRNKTPQAESIVAAVAPSELAREVAALTPLDQSGSLAVYLATAAQIPNALREIGRLREITFRAAGEGTGHSLDLDQFDQHYLHLFVWNAACLLRCGAGDAPCRTATVRERIADPLNGGGVDDTTHGVPFS